MNGSTYWIRKYDYILAVDQNYRIVETDRFQNFRQLVPDDRRTREYEVAEHFYALRESNVSYWTKIYQGLSCRANYEGSSPSTFFRRVRQEPRDI